MKQQFNRNWDGIYRNLVTEAMAHYEANSRFPMSPIGTPAKEDTSNSEAHAKTFFEILCQRTGNRRTSDAFPSDGNNSYKKR